jgi:hypothetical protein
MLSSVGKCWYREDTIENAVANNKDSLHMSLAVRNKQATEQTNK